ncbi:hypothetical protein HPB52_007640 [Rhipicephalus sanguineus]|uniref:Uncharacterized protein n=1 Tax=Rhipicephalus sanguineus TaxID=34632 RepID=A0A9D4Q5G7_RHISA|nr:hypothetical protein HPB52_007640 [Rhipicephalus sanguineus]
MSPQKRNLRWLYLVVFASPLLIQRSTAYSVKSNCGKPQPRGKNCRPIPGKGRFPECCTKLLCQTGFSPSNMGSLTQQAKKILLESDGAPAMKRAAPEPVKQLARSAPRSASSSARSSDPRLINEVLRGNAVSRGRSGGELSRADEDLMESVRTVGLEPSDTEERREASEDTEK